MNKKRLQELAGIKTVNELEINNPSLFNKFKDMVDDWVYELASWTDLDWDEEERIFKAMSQSDLENYSSMEHSQEIKVKHNDNTDYTVLCTLSNAWDDFKINPKKFELIMSKCFPDDE